MAFLREGVSIDGRQGQLSDAIIKPPELFGTDGVRDRAGEGLLAPESVSRLVRATARVLRERERFANDFPPDRGRVVFIGRDTRASGGMLFEQVATEFQRAGYEVADLGVLPTPGVAYTASVSPECGLAVVLSASHNPAAYNGIKFMSPAGAKISSAFESVVSDVFFTGSGVPDNAMSPASRSDLADAASDAYVRFLVGRSWRPDRLRGKRVFLDAANGAAYKVGPAVFRALGMEVNCLADSPDGNNINDGCGALHPDALACRVRDSKARLGFCFDGDADRMIPVTGSGNVLDGDYVLALAGRAYDRAGHLPKKCIVATVMSNLGLEKSLADAGIDLERTPVGDRHVVKRLVEAGHPVGGEQSGHLIFRPDLPTGDGILAAVRLLDVLESDQLDLDRESAVMRQYPQILRNITVREKIDLRTLPSVNDAVEEAERRLGGEGRLLLRYSGTEPLARVMLEGPDCELIAELAEHICRAIEKSSCGL